ncbi:MAG: hypothetical protein Q9165_008114, partial [Trypethelium subeluteriae]
REGSTLLDSGAISDQLPPNTLLPTSKATKDEPDQMFVVGFGDGPDTSNPLNWSSRYKWAVIIILASVNTIGQVSAPINLATVLCLPAVPQMLLDFHTTDPLFTTILASIWEAGEAVGPLFTAPLSEIFGRSRVYNTTNVIFVVFSVACALSPNAGALIGFRFLSGMGDASIALNASIAGDLFAQEKRGLPIAVLSFPPLLGPFSAITGGVFEVAFFLVFRETYTPRILRDKARTLRKESKDERFKSPFDFDVSLSKADIMKRGLMRPIQMFLKPIVLYSHSRFQ